jgi:hypothetical protein
MILQAIPPVINCGDHHANGFADAPGVELIRGTGFAYYISFEDGHKIVRKIIVLSFG